jgi:hypothetical protein
VRGGGAEQRGREERRGSSRGEHGAGLTRRSGVAHGLWYDRRR